MKVEICSIEEVHPLRAQVLRPGLPLEASKYPLDQGSKTLHLAIKDSLKVMAVATFYPQVLPESGFPDLDLLFQNPYQLRGMAVDPKSQGRGLGQRLLTEAFVILKQQGCDGVWCNAREKAFGFYQRIGFQFFSETFEIAGIGPHRRMWIQL